MIIERELLLRAYEVIRRGEIRIDADCSGESPLAQEIKAALAVPAPVEGEAREGERLKIALMERDWLLGAWAALAGIPQAQAEAEMLKWSEKWRELALARAVPVEREHEVSDAEVERAVVGLAKLGYAVHAGSAEEEMEIAAGIRSVLAAARGTSPGPRTPIEHAKQTCTCGHVRHGHNRRGGACNQCGCEQFVERGTSPEQTRPTDESGLRLCFVCEKPQTDHPGGVECTPPEQPEGER